MDDPAPPTPDPRLRGLLGAYPESLFSDLLYKSCDAADRYGLEWALELAQRLRLESALEVPRTTTEILTARAWQPRFHAALAWLLDHLTAAGLLAGEGRGKRRRYRSVGPLPRAELAAARARCLALDPRNAATLDLFDAAAELYPAVASGEARGEEALFSPQRAPLWAAYFDNGNPIYAVNNRVAAIAAAERWPDRPARVLELGAGFGSASQAVIEEMQRRGLPLHTYAVTEPSAFFRRRAERMLRAGFPATSFAFGTLDMSAPWEPQGVVPGGLDLIVAVNVLHVAPDLRYSLREALQALAPGGWLVLGECLRPLADQTIPTEMVFQILEAFTQVETDPESRPTHGFLTPEQWRRAFAGVGFDAIAVEPDLAAIREVHPGFFTGAVCGRRPL